ncbi:hypothetical protein [Vibrio agarivorans]|uniref:Uncharacterized protein n=1 Tax=Vibrio agarivorans TaxID=153622 RepID=A0ABT7Y7U4_9VIBR|nr:hypothetical protein [Vibrio agarivorans]MDN2483829.1 hypothetical protein [Vibrio agarivorans]
MMTAKNNDEFELPDDDSNQSTDSDKNTDNVTAITTAKETDNDQTSPAHEESTATANSEASDASEPSESIEPESDKKGAIRKGKLKRKEKKSKASTRSAIPFKKIALGTSTIAIIGALGIFAHQSGALSIMQGVFASSSSANKSEVDAAQDTAIAQLTMRFNSLETRYNDANISETLVALKSDLDSIVKQQGELESSLTELNDSFTGQLTDTRNLVDERLRLTSQKISTNHESSNTAITGVNELQSQFKEVQTQINSLTNNLRQVSREQRNLSEGINSSPNAAVIQQPSAQEVITPTVVTHTVQSWSGLSFVNSFEWSNQFIAVLSDNLGSTHQVTVGQQFGDYRISRIARSNIELSKYDGSEIVILERR